MDYLLRTTCVIYFLGGIFCWLVSRDLLRNQTWVLFLCWATILYGVMLAGADCAFGDTANWQIVTGLATFAGGIIMLLLGMTIRSQSLPQDRQNRGKTALGCVEDAAVPSGPERALRFGLRCVGAGAAAGLIGVVLPQRVLGRALTGLGLGAFPDTPLAPVMVFLMRTLFGACFLGGVFFWMVSSDVCHYAAVVRFLGWASVFFGAIITLTDLGTGLPGWLRLIAPVALTVGVAIVLLARLCGRTSQRSLAN